MFDTGLGLLLYHLFLNICMPMVVGLLFMWIFFGTNKKGVELIILSWFVGVGVLIFLLFNMQFIVQDIGRIPYLVVVLILVLCLYIRVSIKKEKVKNFFYTLLIQPLRWKDYIESWKMSSINKKVLIALMKLFVGLMVIFSFIHTISLPTYFDDSFGNWNGTAINIFHDDGMKMIGNTGEILGRGRLGYPVYIALYKAQIASMVGDWNDIYMNLRQRFIYLGFILFSLCILGKNFKDPFKIRLPITLISCMPLLYLHIFDGYMDFPLAVYACISMWYFFSYIKQGEKKDLLLALLFLVILSQIKNEGVIVYGTGIIAGFLSILYLEKKLPDFIGDIQKNRLYVIFLLVFFFSPFFILRSLYGLGYDPSSSDQGFVVHAEIFSVFDDIFFKENNYNIILVFLLLGFGFTYNQYRQKKYASLFPVLTFIFLISISTAVFLFTSNYEWAVTQTVINRLFTMNFICMLFFYPFFMNDKYA